MKKILSIALIALIAVTTVMASPVFSGRFGVRYTYTYDTGVIAAGNRNYMLLTDSNGIWTLDFQSAGFDYTTFKGYASINVAEGLKAIDVELPISLAVSIRTTGQYADYVYSDPNSKICDDYTVISEKMEWSFRNSGMLFRNKRNEESFWSKARPFKSYSEASFCQSIKTCIRIGHV